MVTVKESEPRKLRSLAFLTDLGSSAATFCSEMQKSYLYSDVMNRHGMDGVSNKNSEKGETALKLVFSGEQGLVTKGWQTVPGM